MYQLELLGGIALSGPEGPVSGHATQNRQLALLALLGVAGEAGLSRDKVAAHLCPESDEASARRSVADAVYRLRKSLGKNAITGGRAKLRLNPDVVRCDVGEFEAAFAKGEHKRAAQLFPGPLLDGFHLRESTEFEQWKDVEARRLASMYEGALQTLAARAESVGDHVDAVRWWTRLAEHDPLNSRTVMRLVQAQAEAGDPANAVLCAQEHADLLRRELGVEAPEELMRLSEQLRSPRTSSASEPRRDQVTTPRGSSVQARAGLAAIGPSGVRGRWVRIGAVGVVTPRDQPFVGREEELELLRRFYSDALSGGASVCFVSGEPGAGKTALVEHFAGRIREESPATVVARGSCTAYTGVGDPYLPFREILAQLSGDVGEDVEQGRIGEENASRLRRQNALLRNSTIGSPTRGGGATHGALDQEQVFEQFTGLLERLAGEQPLLLLLDDLHWADKASVALLFHLYRHLGEAPVLLIGTYRPMEVGLGRDGERHPLERVLNEIKRYEGGVGVDLDADAEGNRRRLFEALLDLSPNRLDEEFRDALFRQTRGHPLFTLELLRHMQDEGLLRRDEEGLWTADATPDWTGLPARVEGTIAERIARLHPDLQEVLRVASMEGERFLAPIVAQVLALDERALIRRLGGVVEKKHGIVRSEGLRRVAGRRVAEYRFAHSLFQTYLYDSVDENERAYLHGEVGEALEDVFGDRAPEIAPELARHFEMAAVPEKAVKYHAQAGENALGLFATAEAIGSFERALTQLELLPRGEDRDRMELELQERLGSCLVASGRYGSPETRAAYERARMLCERLRQNTDAPILRALSLSALVTGEMARAHELAEELMESARLEQDPVWIVEGHYAMGVTSFWLGHFAASREHLEEALELYRPELAGVHTSLYAQNPRVVCRCRLAWTLWYLGYLDRSLGAIEENLAFARELEHPHSLAYALTISSYLWLNARELERAEQLLDEVLALVARRRLPFWAHRERIVRGWVQAVRGDAAGVEQLRRYTKEYHEDGNFLLLTQDLGRLAELHLKLGETDEGMEALSQAFALAERTDERYYVAELHRLRGELLLSRNVDEAEAAFQQALELARQQEARWLELRAAISLGRMWDDQGRTRSARSLLLQVLDGYTEGAKSHEVLEARALLGT